MSRSLLLLCIPFLLMHGAFAASTAEAESRLHSVVDSVIKIAERTSSTDGLAEKLRPLLQKYISFDAMTRRSVGPGWRQFSKDQQNDAIKKNSGNAETIKTTQGDPVNLTTGEFTYENMLMNIPGSRAPYELDVRYTNQTYYN